MEVHLNSIKSEFMKKLPEATMYCGEYEQGFKMLGAIDYEHRGVRYYHGPTVQDREFHYILYPWHSFERDVLPHIPRKGSFIDIGCGAGDKLALVKTHRPKLNVFGIEHDPWMVSWGQALVGDGVMLGDAFKTDYSTYDFIYAYWPIANVDEMNRLIGLVLQQKKAKAQFHLMGFNYYLDKKYKVTTKGLQLHSI